MTVRLRNVQSRYLGETGALNYSLPFGSPVVDGLSLSPAGVISGTPTAAGAFTVTIAATSANAATGMLIRKIQRQLLGPILTITPPPFATRCG
mgnify:CR=1 FL=1